MSTATPYPTVLPTTEAMDVVDYIRGTMTDRAQFLHGAWVVTGYGLGQYAPPPMTSAAAADIAKASLGATADEAARQLERACKSHEAGMMLAIPWGLILPIIMQLVIDLLSRKTDGPPKGEEVDPWARPPGQK